MDYQYKTTGSILSGVLIIICGFITAPIGLGLLLSYPHEIWWLGIILSGSSILLLYSGIQTIKKSREDEKKAQQFLMKMLVENEKKNDQKEIASIPSSTETKPVLLASWEFSIAEWQHFLKKELNNLVTESIILFISIAILGAALLIFTKGASFSIAAIVSAVVGGIIGVLKYLLKKNTLQYHSKKNVSILIGLDSVILNGKLVVLRDENKWLSAVSIKTDQSPEIIEFVYNWNTRKGNTFDEFRIPIPNDKLSEAKDVVTKIKVHHSIT